MELLQVADAVAREKSIDRDEVLEAMELAIQKAGRSKYGHEHDIRARIDLIRKNFCAIAGARLLELDPCGHLPHLEVPDKLLQAIRDFIVETPGVA